MKLSRPALPLPSVRPIALLILSLLGLLPAVSSAQIRFGEGRAGVGGERAERRGGDPELEAWVRLLTRRMTATHPRVARSAREALVRLGPASKPQLLKLVQAPDPEAQRVAKALLERIARQPAPSPTGREGPAAGGQEGAGRRSLDAILREAKLPEEKRKRLEERVARFRTASRELSRAARKEGADRRELRGQQRTLRQELLKDLGKMLPRELRAEVRRAVSGNPRRAQRGPGGERGPTERKRPGGEEAPKREDQAGPEREKKASKPVKDGARVGA